MTKIEDTSTDRFIICEGESTVQVKAIANNIQKRLKYELDMRPLHVEGEGNAQWILIDYFDTVVHVFYPETRAFYDLEDLWSDAEITEYENI